MTAVAAYRPFVPARHAAPANRGPSLVVALPALGIGLAAIGGIAWFVSPLAAAALYVPLYLALVWVRPDLAFLLIFAANPFPYDLGGGPVKMALAEINLVLAAPVLIVRGLLRGRRFRIDPTVWPVLAYFGACVLSAAANGFSTEAVVSLGQMFIYLIVAVFVFSQCVDLPEQCVTALAGLLASTAALACVAVVTRQAYVLGIHKNAVGSNLAYGCIVCVELWFARAGKPYRRGLAVLTVVLTGGLVFTLSRGAWAAALAGMIVVAAMRRQFKALVRGGIVAAVVVAVCWQVLPQEKQQYVSDLGASAYNVRARVESINFALSRFEESPVVGVGVGLRKDYDATNIVMSTLAETGVLGLAAFASIFLVIFGLIRATRRRMPASDPLFTFLVLGAALPTCQLVHGCVDHYWSRGLLVAWAPVGMALYARSTFYKSRAPAGGRR